MRTRIICMLSLMVRKDDDGSGRLRMEATGVEKKQLDNSLFVAPADYTKLDMNARETSGTIRSKKGKEGRNGMARPRYQSLKGRSSFTAARSVQAPQ